MLLFFHILYLALCFTAIADDLAARKDGTRNPHLRVSLKQLDTI